MNIKLIGLPYLFLVLFTACSNNKVVEIKNDRKGLLKGSVKLHETIEKKFLLDSITAPKAQYSQIFIDSNGIRNFTFLNKNNNTIYFYDYESSKLLSKVPLSEQAFKQVISPAGYYIKSLDSIYVYNMAGVDLFLANQTGNYYNRLSLINGNSVRDVKWILKYPQYYPQTAIPFISTSKGLVLPGQYMETVPDSIINNFKFTAYINLENNKIDFEHIYPRSLYGFNYNWQGQFFTEVYADLAANGEELVFSFPISHDLYVSDLKSNDYNVVYGGSNEAGTISSLDAKSTEVTRDMVLTHFINNDEYGAIKYDPYRKVYYRFLRRAVSPNTASKNWKEKAVVVIVLDEDFNYLGETTIGTLENWFVQNTFVTKEGLNIEYFSSNIDEDYLILKLFTIKKES